MSEQNFENNFPKKEKMALPESFWETQKDAVFNQLEEVKETQEIQFVNWKVTMAIAASFLLGFFLINPSSQEKLVDFNNEDIFAYIIEEDILEELDEEDLMEIHAQTHTQTAIYTDEEIIDFFSEEEINEYEIETYIN